MKEIKAFGGFFENDANGFVINPCAAELIPASFLPVLEFIKKAYQEHFREKLHSIYLRGSLPRGLYQEGISDIDVFALVHDERIRWQEVPWSSGVKKAIQEQFVCSTPIELMYSSYHPQFNDQYPRIAMLLKTQALCIWGDDLQEEIRGFRPNKEMCLHFRWLEQDIADFSQKEAPTRTEIQAILKVIIRTGYELVIEREQRFTPDLYWCQHAFGLHYPKEASKMKQALCYFLNPDSESSAILQLINLLGEKLMVEIN